MGSPFVFWEAHAVAIGTLDFLFLWGAHQVCDLLPELCFMLQNSP